MDKKSSLLLNQKLWTPSLLSKQIQHKAQETSQEAFVVLGTLGAGKTTLLTDLAYYLQRKGEKFKVIVNDIGNFNVDASRLGDFDPIQLTQGCICCDDLDSLRSALLSAKESGEKILIEPTGIADGKGIKNLIAELGMQSRVLTLVNASAYPLQSGAIKNAIATQAQLADVLAFTHLASQEENQEVKSEFSSRYPQKSLIDAPFTAGKENLKKSDEEFADLMQKLRAPKNPQFSYGPTQTLSAHQHVNTLNLELSPAFGYQHLEYVVKEIWEENLLRMKGVINVWDQYFPFDYVKWRKGIEIWTVTNESPKLTVITETALSPEIEKMIKDPAPVKENPNLSFAPKQKIFSPIEVAEKVKVLLQQYKDYMDMDAEKAQLESEYANAPTQDLAKAIDELKLKLDKLGDDMKFDNPLIWIGYKRLAYANNPAKKVGTIWELLKHCERKTDICHRRLDFLNQNLKEQFGIDLFDAKKVNPDQLLTDFLQEYHVIQDLSNDEAFMAEWLEHEYFQLGGKTAKWQSYHSSDA